jgi:outer membrane protein insertion porin family
MMFHRPGCLRAWVLCSVVVLPLAGVRQAAAQNPQNPQQQPAQQPPPKAPSPFETVPQSPAEAPKPAPPPAQPTVQPAPQAPQATRPGQPPENIIAAINFRGARRVRQDTLQALIFSKKGDKFDEESLHRDFVALWNSQRFDDLRIEREPGKEGWIITFIVVERPVVRTIKYEGNKSISQSDILDAFKEKKVGLVVESQYDPNKV